MTLFRKGSVLVCLVQSDGERGIVVKKVSWLADDINGFCELKQLDAGSRRSSLSANHRLSENLRAQEPLVEKPQTWQMWLCAKLNQPFKVVMLEHSPPLASKPVL